MSFFGLSIDNTNNSYVFLGYYTIHWARHIKSHEVDIILYLAQDGSLVCSISHNLQLGNPAFKLKPRRLQKFC